MTEPKRGGGSGAAGDETRQVGRGALYLTGSKFWFLISGYAIYFGLPRLLGEGEEAVRAYGDYGVVTGFLALLSQPLIQGTTQAVSRFVSRDPSQVGAVRRAAYKLQAVIGGALFAGLLLAAPWIAEGLYDHAELTNPLRCVSFVLLFYAFYAIFAGTLNGTRQFGRQALADFSYSNLKLIGILGGAALFARSLGPIVAPVAGFAVSAGLIMLIGYALAGRAAPGGKLSPRQLLAFQAFTILFTALSTAVVRIDLQFLKIFADGDQDQVRLLSGFYQAAQAFATIPFQAVFAITFVLFPLVSGAAGRDDGKIREYIRQTTRYAGVISIAVVALFAACPERTITILYRPEYAVAGDTLRIMCCGALFYSVFYIMTAIITAAGRPGVSSVLMGITVAIQAGLCVVLVKTMGMEGVALATAISMTVGFVAAHLWLSRSLGQGVVLGVFAKTVACGAVTSLAAHAILAHDTFWGGSGVLSAMGGTGIVAKLMTVAGFSAFGIGYLVLLSLTGVLTAEDKAKFLRVVRKG